MIAIDTSALVAILYHEPEAGRFLDVARSRRTLIGYPTLLELRMVTSGRSSSVPPQRALGLIELLDCEPVAFDAEHLRAAERAFDRFGKGRHPASLNFGDCMAYAVAAVAGCPLLFKGDDFARTDIRSAS